MNDCPRCYAQKNALMGFLLSGQVVMPDGAALIRPTGMAGTGFVGRIRCLHRHPADVISVALRLV
ncbi:hypothetical protein EOL25_04785 [Citrobacter freundii]|nr:hypothetical protein EOL25_04785 [Citrobacter freundii]